MDITITIFSLIILLFSVVIHELAHGSVANSLGDPTAKYEGRLTLNPLKHLDMFGSIILPLLLLFATAGQGPVFGWAKPVPINPYNFKDQKWGSLKVALAGPLSNFALALVFGLLLRFAPYGLLAQAPGIFLMFSFIVQINIMLAIFNLVPIPPLDGSHIFLELLPRQFDRLKLFVRQYGLYLLLFFIFFGGLQFIASIVQTIFSLITGM
ncbi:MAG: hypothetical protein A3C50_00540 [Candidatus Staskawiczbacteria bacterium RIFCSPHIGHO2_02_FULL_43_16]|uniref:Peptidase M50 domain-containing protein n=1 Tax=Candidatus Staskawiczbacteria bacterium RIFCSPHIGHO2_01_FULL_41_41 TaxID=1802203 RepID=A0A1G2HSX3_9BACT|nr:MAG: hypothetical protein A2822_04355 [Candidatus Staskawiczbacteria bacterium RIFCSPHIGHO2_01_FULL_41_41]OGZ68250.1 MAG: hypothetical protein A3C50_00540 [Candidatus Staskawiczbacteria bacterium RIFCSPHIGHO2_02_FULL_43_16]OGZ74638.1 MAG: hypothetical protein A3A12_00635 [Candidatus Staskawiczbacteria bacterium RIFCSPLOWO2_01_FULL_43_17b]